MALNSVTCFSNSMRENTYHPAILIIFPSSPLPSHTDALLKLFPQWYFLAHLHKKIIFESLHLSNLCCPPPPASSWVLTTNTSSSWHWVISFKRWKIRLLKHSGWKHPTLLNNDLWLCIIKVKWDNSFENTWSIFKVFIMGVQFLLL